MQGHQDRASKPGTLSVVSADPPSKAKPVAVLRNGLKCMEQINAEGALSVAECAHRTGLARTTVHRLLETLRAEGYILRSRDGRYRAGLSSQKLCSGFVEEHWISTIARPVLDDLSLRMKWRAGLSIPNGMHMSLRYLTSATTMALKHWASGSLISVPESAAGILYLAMSAPDERATLYERLQTFYDQRTNEYWERVYAEVSVAQQRGFATCRMNASENSLAVPLIVDGNFLASLGFQYIRRAVRSDQIEREYVPILHEAASTLSSALGGRAEAVRLSA